MMKRIFIALALAVPLTYAVFSALNTPKFACVPLPDHTPLATRHGNDHWSDEKLRVFSAMPTGVEIPQGWQAVGADAVTATCALFPPHQAVVFIKPEFWQIDSLKINKIGFEVRRLALKSTSQADFSRIDQKIVDTFQAVSSLFPRGLRPDQEKRSHDILVTIDIAGDNRSDATRIYPAPGPNLSSLFYNLDSNRGTDLFIHALAHFYNKQRPRMETTPVEDELPKTEYLEFVASWTELALNHNHDYVKKRVRFLKRQHKLLTDKAPNTWPTYRALKDIQHLQGPFGIPPQNDAAAIEYAHYYLSPLILLAIDGLLAIDAPSLTVKAMLQDIHKGKSPGLLSSIQQNMPMRYSLIRKWMSGEKKISSKLISRGLIRLHSGPNEAIFKSR